jgi:hypothetical protein
MITLTTPTTINSILGGSAPVPYDKLVIGPFTMDPVAQTITGTLRLTSSANASMQPITGSLRISVPAAEVIVEVQQLDFYRRIITSSPQNTAILGWIEAAQAQIENGLIAVSIIAGNRTAGA